MSDIMVDGPDESGDRFEKERLRLIQGGDKPEETSFLDMDPDALPDVRDVPIEQFRIGPMKTGATFDAEAIASYVAGAACGNSIKEAFKDRLVKAMDKYRASKDDPDATAGLNMRLMDNYDLIDENYPRLMPLLDRFRNENILPIDQFVEVNKLSMLITLED